MENKNIEGMAKLPVGVLDECRDNPVLRKRMGFGGATSIEAIKAFRKKFREYIPEGKARQ